jgi:GNAT superfamily N-acetyltransferase
MLRSASLADIDQILDVCIRHEQRIDKDVEPISRADVEISIKGVGEPGHTIVWDQDGEITALCFLVTDSGRKRCELDLFFLDSLPNAEDVFAASLSHLKSLGRGFEVMSSANQKDLPTLNLIQSFGFKFYRNYWKLVRQNGNDEFPTLPVGVEIKQLSFNENANLYWRLEMDSFSEHFGYKYVEFEPWFRQREEDSLIDQHGCFAIYKDGVAAGYLMSSNGREELQGGFIDKLGVVKSMQGQGLGRKLLQHGIAHSVQKGYTSIALGVDSGNESGAIALYESVGFEPHVVWSAYRLPDLL